MIFTERKITVNKGKSTIDRPVILYRGDYEVEIRFTIVDTDFKYINGNNNNATEKASHAQLAILGPDGTNVFSDISVCMGGQVAFVLTKEMIDELSEVGLYSFQIRLFDYYRESRVSIPPVEFGIEVREPVASEDHTNAVDESMTGYSIAKVVDGLNEDVGDTFDDNGNYNKTDWETGDRISQGKLNKIEDALDKINQNEKADVAALDKRVTNNFNVLDSTKADNDKVLDIQGQVNNLVLGAVGDGNNAEVIQARGTFSVLNERFDHINNTKVNNVSVNLLNTSLFLRNATNSATVEDLGGGVIAFTATASWGGTYNYIIDKPIYNHVYAILATVKGASCWGAFYKYSASGTNLGGSNAIEGSDRSSGENADDKQIFVCFRLDNPDASTFHIGLSTASGRTVQIVNAVVMDLGEISDDTVPTYKAIFKSYGYWTHSIPNFTCPNLALKALEAETAINAANAANATNADRASVAAYAESGDFADIAKIHKNELPKLENISFWVNGCTHTIENDEIIMNPSSVSGWGGELLYRFRPDNKTNIDISKRKYLFTALVKRYEADAKVRVRWFLYSGDFSSMITSASSSIVDIVNEDYSRITHIYEMPTGTNVFAVGLMFSEPNTAFKSKEWMCIDVTGMSDTEIASLRSLIDSEEYWAPFPKFARVAITANSANSLTNEYEALLINKAVSTAQNAKFLDVTDKLAWTTKTYAAGSSTSWWVANDSKNLDLNSTYIYIVRWHGQNKASFQRCNELRNGAWYGDTTLYNKSYETEDTIIRTWMFKTDDKVNSPTLCCVTNNPTLTIDVTITVELYKILDEKYIDEQFAYDISKAYMEGNSIKSYDFSDIKKWGEDDDTNQCKWKGKKALVIGDSITAAGKWQLKLASELGMLVSTHAKGGVGTIAMVDGDKGLGGDYDNETNASGTLYPLNTDDVKDKDLIVVLPCYNNRGAEEGKIGDCYDPSTRENNNIAGMVQYLINRVFEELTEAGNLNCKILIATPHCAGAYNYNYVDGYGEWPAGSGRTMETLSNTIKEVANYNNIPVCDLWHNSGINKFTWTIYGANSNAVNEQYSRYKLDAQGNPVSDEVLRYATGSQYYQWRNGVVVLETYNGSAPYPFCGDQLHCSSAGYARIGECIVGSIIRAYGY